MTSLKNSHFAFVATLVIALSASFALAQARGHSRPSQMARPSGMNRSSMGSGGGHMTRSASRPSAFRSTSRAGQSIGGRNLGATRPSSGGSRNLGAVRPSSGGSSQPRMSSGNSPRPYSGNSFGRSNGSTFNRLTGNSNGQRGGSSIGQSGNSGGQRGGSSFGQSGNSGGQRGGSWINRGSGGSSGPRGGNSFGNNGNSNGRPGGSSGHNGNNGSGSLGHSGNSNGQHGGNFGGHNGNSGGQHGGNSFGRGNGYSSAPNRWNSPGHHNGNNSPSHNYWNRPRHSGYVNGINVYNGYCRPAYRSSIIGCGPGFRYSSGYCGTGYPYYGGYYGGGYAWRYPIYSDYGYYGGVSYDTYSEGDVFDSLSTDVEVTQEEIDESERAAQETQDMRDAGLQSNALDQFGQKYAEPAAPTATGMSPETQQAAREIGEALGRGDRAFEAGSYDKAREEYVRAVVLAGEDASVRIALGLADYALGSYTDASVAVRRGAARSPSLASSEFDLRSVYGNQTDFESHRRMLGAHVAANPDDSDARFLLGFVQFFSGERDEGKRTLDAYLSNVSHDDSVREFIETAKVAMPR